MCINADFVSWFQRRSLNPLDTTYCNIVAYLSIGAVSPGFLLPSLLVLVPSHLLTLSF